MATADIDYVLQHGRELFIELSPTGRIHTASAAFAALLSRKPDDLRGRLLADFLSDHDARELANVLGAVVGGETEALSKVCRLTLPQAGGPGIDVILCRWQVFRPPGDPVIAAIVIDNRVSTEIEKAITDGRLYPSQKEGLPICILRKSLDLKIVSCNSLFEQQDLLPRGLTREDLKRDTVDDVTLYGPVVGGRYQEDDKTVLATGKPLPPKTEPHPSPIEPSEVVQTLKQPIVDKNRWPIGIEVAFGR